MSGGSGMRVVVSGGGTGGHVYPAIALAQRLTGEHPGSEVLFLGSSTGPEKNAARAAGVPFEGIPLEGFSGRSPLQKARALRLFAGGLLRARRILAGFGPDCVVGTGGYASAPACFSAALSRIPFLLHEMNLEPGIVTRLLAGRASAVAVAFTETEDDLARGSRVVVTGVPVRREIERLSGADYREEAAAEALEEFELLPDRKTVLVFGGSQGALAINRDVWQTVPRLTDREDLQLLHITGTRGYQEAELKHALTASSRGGMVYRALPYTERMDLAYAVAGVAVTRAGAGTVAELISAALPAVLVPYPHAAGGHQLGNAGPLLRAGAAEVVEQSSDVAEGALGEALSIVDEPSRRGEMAAAYSRIAVGNGAEGIVSLIEEISC